MINVWHHLRNLGRLSKSTGVSSEVLMKLPQDWIEQLSEISDVREEHIYRIREQARGR